MGHPIHHLEIVVGFARAEVRLNGLPVDEAVARNNVPVSVAPPVNPYLAGARNVIEVVLDTSTGFDGKPLPFTRATFEVTVRRFVKGEVVEPGAGELVTRFVPPPELLAEIAEGKRPPPVTLTHRFASPSVDFSAELLDAPPFTDEAALRDYAMRLRSLAVKRDVAGLLAEYEPKIHAWSVAYEEPVETLAASMQGVLADFIGAGADVAFTPDDIVLKSWCGGRVWELRRTRGLPLLRTLPGPDGERTELTAFVAPRSGKLRIVR